MIKNLNIDGHQLAVLNLNLEDTPGQPVFLMHGIGGLVHFWNDEQTPVFREQGPCYALSLPGHYPAAFPQGFRQEQITAVLLAELLVKAIREIAGDRPVTLAGVSTGGFCALAIAAQVPHLVSRLVCISGFCQGRWTGALGLAQKLARLGWPGRTVFKYLYRAPHLTAEKYNRKWGVFAHDVQAMHACPYFRTCTDASYPGFMQLNLDDLLGYFAVMPDIDIRDWLSRIKARTLVIAGDHDPIVPPRQALLIQQGIPGAELVMIPGGGHMLFAERSQAYQAALCQWFQRHP